MSLNPTSLHPAEDPLCRHRCGQCIQNDLVLQKYKKLVDLLYKKIRQLQKKGKSHLTQRELQAQPNLQSKKTDELQSWLGQEGNTAKNMQNGSNVTSNEKQVVEARTKESFLDEPTKKKARKQLQMAELEKLEKVSFVINGLTEQVMQLKSNFMHIRHCVYAFVKELNLGERIYSNPIVLNIALALLSIFEFSENEKEEMFNRKKIKLRKKEKNRNKENVFVTIKEI